MGFSDSRDQIGTRIELFPEEIRSESGQLSGVVDIEAGTRADDLEAPCFQAEMDLQLAEEKRHLDRLRSRVCVNLVQHEEPQTSIVKEWSVARQEQQVLQHRVVCDENMRGRLQHFERESSQDLGRRETDGASPRASLKASLSRRRDSSMRLSAVARTWPVKRPKVMPGSLSCLSSRGANRK